MNGKEMTDERMLSIDNIDDPAERQDKYEELIGEEEQRLKEAGLTGPGSAGSFWEIEETRPYMRFRHRHMMCLIDQGKYEQALSECEEMLRLCKKDSLGVRYVAMALYAFFEKEDEAFAMYKFFNEDAPEMLLPFSALYYKLDMLRYARRYLFKAYAKCDGLIDFLTDDEKRDEAVKRVQTSGMYDYGTIEQIADIFINDSFLFSSEADFVEWAADELAEFE